MALLTGTGNFSLTIEEAWSMKGRANPAVRLQFYGMLDRCHSIGNVSAQFSRRLLRDHGPLVGLHGFSGSTFFDVSLQPHAWLNTGADIGVFYGVPDQVRNALDGHRVKIGCFVCETDRIHPDWVRICNRLDLVVVPSHFCRQAFMDSGVTIPVMVVPHGLEPEYHSYRDKQRSTPFIFYNTFSLSSYPERKSCEELIRCFMRAFPAGENVMLRLRTQHDARVEKYLRDAGADDRIVIDPPNDCSTEEFARIYSDVHCTVHPSKGEGFGLIPFQSIACETPVIAPAVTGMADYLNADNAILLKMGGRVAGIGVGNQSGTYYSVDEDHLVHCLRHAYDHWEQEYRKVRQAAPAFRRAHSWDAALAQFSTLIGELLCQERPVPASIPKLLTLAT